jgi:hypothetical protein
VSTLLQAVLRERDDGDVGAIAGQLPGPAQLTYVLGALDAWQTMAAMLSGVAPNEKAWARSFSSLPACVADRRMTGGQIEAIVRKHVDETPGEWDRPMAFLVWQAMTMVCK